MISCKNGNIFSKYLIVKKLLSEIDLLTVVDEIALLSRADCKPVTSDIACI